MTYEFKTTEGLSLENSFGVIRQQNDIELDVIIGINEDGYGWFEFYDTDTGGDDWYAEGSMTFNGKELVDYDGVFSLPICIINKLKELGYDTSYAE